MPDNAPVLPCLSPVGGKPVHVAFDGGRLTSDAGVLVLAEIEHKLGIAERLARCIEDPRDPQRVTHQVAEMIRFRAPCWSLPATRTPTTATSCGPTRRSSWRSAGCRRRGPIYARSQPSAGWRTCPGRRRSSG